MKKIIKISLLILIIGLCISIKSFADSPFQLDFKGGYEVNMGETIEIPLVLSGVKPDGINQNLSSVKCKIQCDENAFEIVNFNINNSNANMDYSKYYSNANTVYYVSSVDITEITEIGKIQLKAKNNIKTGNYEIKVTDIEAGNGEGLLTIGDSTTQVYVKGINSTEEEEIVTEEKLESQKVEEYGAGLKEIQLRIQMKSDGTQLVITPDEVNGGKVGILKVNGKEIERKDDQYTVETEPNTFYQINVYDISGNMVYSKGVITTVLDNTEDDIDDKIETDENKDDEKKDDNGTNNDKKEEATTEKENANKSSEDVKKSPQTGDSIYTSIALLVVATCAWVIAYGVKYVKEQ